MAPNVNNKVVLITGASSGFGKLIAERLAPLGAKLILSDIVEKAGQEVATALNTKHGKGTAVFVKCDVGNDADLKALFAVPVKLYGRLDICFNNAGISEKGLFIADPDANWKKVMEVDLNSVIYGTQLAMNIMRKQSPKGGVIVNTASMAGFIPGVGMPVYCAAKFGVVGFTRSLDANLTKATGIRVVGIAPTFSETPLLTSEEAQGNEIMTQIVKAAGTVPVPLVIDAFMLALEDETLAGDIIRITRKHGIDILGRRPRPRPRFKHCIIVLRQKKCQVVS
ncbi:hypothetical protein BC829DRAFT_431474 [Chytridium lagenaria]|nr:hypothetical protein BC829DRAFT_431474 [Chytridium lagenaria]